MRFLPTLLFVGLSVVMSQAGVIPCPVNYGVFPIAGASGGTSASCGNAGVTATTAFAATPGNGTVATSLLSSFLGFNLSSSLDGKGFTATEGSAVLFTGFTVSPGSTISFNFDASFEEGGTGALFYILNGSLVLLGQIVPTTEGLPGAFNSGSVTTPLAAGSNTLSFGAVTLRSTDLQGVIADPQLSLSNLVVTSTGVPEPATFGMMGLALAGLALFGRQKG